jgi:hypothetical protein
MNPDLLTTGPRFSISGRETRGETMAHNIIVMAAANDGDSTNYLLMYLYITGETRGVSIQLSS